MNVNTPMPDFAGLKEQIRQAIDAHPDLSYYGWRYARYDEADEFTRNREHLYSDDSEAQVKTVLIAAATRMPKGSALRIAQRGSYGLKHAVEHWVRQENRKDLSSYIANGALILALIIAGWKPRRAPDSPNCRFSRGGKR